MLQNILQHVVLKSGYWQIAMADEDKEKTAFSAGKDLYQFRRMLFGWTNAPASFQRFMNYVTHKIRQVMVYLDDIMIYAKTFQELLLAMRSVFIRMRQWNFKAKPSKREFTAQKWHFLAI